MENRVQRQAGRRTNRIVSPPIENPFYGRAWKLLDLLVRDLRHQGPCLSRQCALGGRAGQTGQT